MSANIKCYDPASGRVLFDLASGICRIVGKIDSNSTSGQIDISATVVGNANLFVIPAEYNKSAFIGNTWQLQQGRYAGFNYSFDGTKLTYEKRPEIVLYYGFYI